MQQALKMYHIAIFPSTNQRTDEVEIVHEAWLLSDRKTCYFPLFMRGQLKKALQVGMLPSIEWKTYSMRILKSYDSYEKALENLAVAEMTSNLESDYDVNPRKKRKKINRKKDRALSDSDLEYPSNKKHNSLPLPPSIDFELEEIQDDSLVMETDLASLNAMLINHQKPMHLATVTTPVFTPLLQPSTSTPHMHQPSTSTLLLQTPNTNNFPLAVDSSTPKSSVHVTSFEKKMLKWMEVMDSRSKENSLMLANILFCMKSREDCLINATEDLPQLPISTHEEMSDLEQFLGNPVNFKKMVCMMSHEDSPTGSTSLTFKEILECRSNSNNERHPEGDSPYLFLAKNLLHV